MADLALTDPAASARSLPRGDARSGNTPGGTRHAGDARTAAVASLVDPLTGW